MVNIKIYFVSANIKVFVPLLNVKVTIKVAVF